ncbi:MAG: integrase core domain-containing protein [Myxococcales bacterium]|nr:integrase core domain-containing protein [Myxococcales bacterium]
MERLWRTLKHEEVYLNDYDDLIKARIGIGRYLKLYNERRPHQALGCQTRTGFYDFEMNERLSILAAAE